MEKGYSFPQEVLTKLGIYMQKKNKQKKQNHEPTHRPYHVHKN